MATANAGYEWKRMGSQHPATAPYDAFPCQDGHVFVALVLDSHWAKFCNIINREDLIDDPRAAHTPDRAQNRDFVNQTVREWTEKLKVDEVIKRCDEAQLVTCPIMTLRQLIDDEHIKEREIVTEVEHPVVGKTKITGVATKYSLSQARTIRPAPLLGEHNKDIYQGWLEISGEEMDSLQNKGII
jgi:crotonobetainyl-CoA:carnitine CoA-transferase CaiB-like acyl-CoA transferase